MKVKLSWFPPVNPTGNSRTACVNSIDPSSSSCLLSMQLRHPFPPLLLCLRCVRLNQCYFRCHGCPLCSLGNSSKANRKLILGVWLYSKPLVEDWPSTVFYCGRPGSDHNGAIVQTFINYCKWEGRCCGAVLNTGISQEGGPKLNLDSGLFLWRLHVAPCGCVGSLWLLRLPPTS